MKVFKTSRGDVAAWRETFKPHATARRRNERTRNFLRIIKALRSGVAAWREEKQASRDDATAQRKAKKKLVTENKIAFQSIPEKIC
jgi:hypothetical protein